MSEAPKKTPVEFKTCGTLTEKGILISEQSSIDQLSSRGYGALEGKTFTLAFFEALYLQDKGMLEAKNQEGNTLDFQSLLHCYEEENENAWVNYLVYRDFRSRGYVVREGFGLGIDFRIYGVEHMVKACTYLILVIRGKPLSINDLAMHCLSVKAKKELILALLTDEIEIVHYSVGVCFPV